MQAMKRSSANSPQVPAAVRGFRRRRRGIVLFTALAAGQGCYTYHPAELGSLVPPEEIRVELDEAEYRKVAPGGSMVGPPRVEGKFARVAGDSLVMSVWIGDAYRGTPFESSYQDVSIPLGEVVRTESRRLSRGRTALASAGAVAIIAVLIDSIGLVDIFRGWGDDDLPTPPETGAGAVR